MKRARTHSELLLENEELRARLEEAEETLRAIRNHEVDALMVEGPEGEQVFTLKGAEQPYRIIVEAMGEGAVTDRTGRDRALLYNRRFAEIIEKTTPPHHWGRLPDVHRGRPPAFVGATAGRAGWRQKRNDAGDRGWNGDPGLHLGTYGLP